MRTWNIIPLSVLLSACVVDDVEVEESAAAVEYSSTPVFQESVASIVDRVIGDPVVDGVRRYRGLSIGVIRNGQRYMFHRGETVKGGGVKPNSSTLYAIGSVTKTFTATMLADYDRRGVVDLDDRVDEHTSYTIPSPRHTMTLRNLATHRSGLPRQPPGGVSPYQTGTYAGDFDALMESLSDCSAGCDAPSSSDTGYSNYAFAVLAYVLSRTTHPMLPPTSQVLTVQGALSKYVIDPLGMTSTNNKANLTDHAACVDASDPCTYGDYGVCTYQAACNYTFSPRAAVGHNDGHNTRLWTAGSDDNIKAGSGVLWSSPTDMMKWLAYNMDLGDSGAPSTMRALLPVVHGTLPMGWGRETMSGGYDLLFKTGTLPDDSFNAHVTWIEGGTIGVFILANSDYNTKAKARELLDELR